MSILIEEIKIGIDQDTNCKFGLHVVERLEFLFDPENKLLMVDTTIIKAKFCSECGKVLK